ncbi:helix-turn-helix transcriptional regulator [Lacticaseibacillus porcinae]|uniref:helix-turn-helix transcriptional regulator n=1 Tax=Lacticaseibacillus porcinae TaxID=1123687 RepID=UPI0013DE56C0|nr:helix-turn-helix transcriptional regulator [Lacticaseibacillus porcinae]
MQIGKQIQIHRQRLGLTQDALAGKLFVTRQTISNWENDRHYPDIENLLLLSQLFQLSLDELVKGDVVQMKHELKLYNLDRDAKLMLGLMLASLISIGPSLYLLKYWTLLPSAIFWGIAMIFALRLEAFKKKADVHTYQEILAYMQGKDVEELRQQRHKRRDLWSKAIIVLLFAVVSGVIALLVSLPYLLWH